MKELVEEVEKLTKEKDDMGNFGPDGPENEEDKKKLLDLFEKLKNSDICRTMKEKDFKSKMVLYNYDAFLFDFDYKEDGLKYLKEVKKILEWDGKYPTRVFMGDNYHSMKEITEKLSV